MNFQVKNRHFIIFVLLVIILLRFSRLSEIAVLLFSFVVSFFKETSETLSLFNFSLADNFFSIFLIFVLVVYLTAWGRKQPILNKKLNLTSSVIISLLTFFIFSPLVSTCDPDFQGNIGTTKLLPPFSQVKILIPLEKSTEFPALRYQLLNKPVIYIDSIKKEGNKFYYFQKENKKLAEPEKIRI